MNEIERNLMKGMVSILNEAAEAYYNTGNPIMSDEMYDMRLEDLRQMEEEIGFSFSNSPTHKVGAKVLTELNEVAHTSPMLSLDKCHNVNELLKFINNKETIASIKLDGLTCRLTYENGVLVRAETRGNGIAGSDITEHVKQFLNIPMKINKDNTYILDGEAIILDEDFAEINQNGEYKNSRNLASGTLSVLDTSLVAKRRMRFYGWNAVEGGSNSLKDNLAEAKLLGFDIVPHWFNSNNSYALNPDNLQSNIDYVFEYARDNGYPHDGVVFKYNDIEYGKSLGSTSHHFRDGIAYKAKDEVYRTKLIDIDWTMGKTGILTPTAIFEPVEISGSTVSRASVHNVSILTKLDLHIGDTVEVAKCNEIIPQVKRNVSSDERTALGKEPDYITYPSHCPICGGLTKLETENSSTVLVCTNDNCKGKLLGKLTHFVSKNAMDIDNLSSATLEKFIELGWLTKLIDIYYLDVNKEEMTKLEGFGEKSVKKLLNSIEKSKNTTLDKFIYALSIPNVGRSTAKTIASRFEDYYEFIARATDFDWEELDGIGLETASKIDEFIQSHIGEIKELANELEFEEDEIVTSNNLSGLTFCITGSLNHFANRDEAKEKIEQAGGNVSGSVSAKTSYLVNNDVTSTSGKNKKAKELNIPIISEEELIKMLN
jgi:DNA ligase (NAD+)